MTRQPTARERFIAAVKTAGGNGRAADALGCTRQYVDMIARGKRKPGMRVARAIEAMWGIPMQAWLPAPRIESVLRVATDPVGR